MFPTLGNPVFAEFAEGIEQAAREEGWSVLLTTTAYREDYERQALETLLSHRVEGLLLTVTDGDKSQILDQLDAEAMPYVLLLNQPRRTDRNVITVDNIEGAYTAARALVDQGHRRLCMIAGRLAQSDRSKRRYEGFARAIEEAGLPPGMLIELPFETENHRTVLRDVLNRSDRPTGYFCSGDLLALNMVGLFAECGVSVPQDVSVIGFDGIEIGQLLLPGLTTISQPSRSLGRQAVSLLMEHLEAPQSNEALRRFVPHELLVRQTLSGPGT